MKTFIYLSTCDTCSRIIKELGISKEDYHFYNLKDQPISKELLDHILNQGIALDDLINRRSRKYQSEGWGKKDLSKEAFYELLLQEYTLIKRPILLDQNRVFVGNSKKVVAAMKEYLENE
ncbi:MAG: hypothetical protein N4A45_03705 [Flavobacteriales bacterium]|jgi:arsenate reductase|nr:hypothetical protein [Flavobacteriales bacterium]